MFIVTAVETVGDISGVIINVDKTTKQVLDAKASSLKVTGSSQKALCRPMITIFK